MPAIAADELRLRPRSVEYGVPLRHLRPRRRARRDERRNLVRAGTRRPRSSAPALVAFAVCSVSPSRSPASPRSPSWSRRSSATPTSSSSRRSRRCSRSTSTTRCAAGSWPSGSWGSEERSRSVCSSAGAVVAGDVDHLHPALRRRRRGRARVLRGPRCRRCTRLSSRESPRRVTRRLDRHSAAERCQVSEGE